jgi:hypothetical protein
MLADPKPGHFRPKSSRPGRTGSSRTVGAAYTGATRFRQCFQVPQPGFFETAQFSEYIGMSGVFPCEDGGSPGGHYRSVI